MATPPHTSSRRNQQLRTRKDLLEAAGRLLKAGKTPTMEEVAEEALVSRATAYRYFPAVEALLIEAPCDGEVPAPDTLFADEKVAVASPEERVDFAEAALHEMIYRNEAQLRLMLAHTVTREAKDGSAGSLPVRQNRRIPLIEAALAPVRGQLSSEQYSRLCAALAVYFGTESMIVFRDVLSMDEQEARAVKSWAVRALVRTAMADAARKKG